LGVAVGTNVAVATRVAVGNVVFVAAGVGIGVEVLVGTGVSVARIKRAFSTLQPLRTMSPIRPNKQMIISS